MRKTIGALAECRRTCGKRDGEILKPERLWKRVSPPYPRRVRSLLSQSRSAISANAF